MSRELALMPATELLANYRAKKLSPVEATRAALARIAALNGRFNAFCRVDEEGALAAARASERRWQRGEARGLVDGITTSVKDIVLAKGWPTLRGSKAISPDQAWDEDAPAVARLREQGAVLLGRTTTPEFGWKGVTDSPLTGITRNPWNDRTTPGGSSGGAAVAAATGMGALHVGTDGGGSIRIPAGFTGIFGFKQSFGRVPAHPLSPFGTLAHIGPLTRTVADGALMLNVLTLPDERVTFGKPVRIYKIRRSGESVAWDSELIKSLRYHMGLSQAEFAEKLGVRQQTISEWETGIYAPSRATRKYLTLVGERAGFVYGEGDEFP